MLKIKDSVDLKVLENFGFGYHPKHNRRRYIRGNIFIYENNDTQRKESCKKFNLQYFYPRVIYIRNYQAYLNSDGIDDIPLDSVLMELIQAGIVEVFEDD